MQSKHRSVFVTIAFLALAGIAAAQTQLLTSQRFAAGFSRPLYAGCAPGDTSRVFVIEQFVGTSGRIRIIRNGQVVLTPFLTVPNVSTGNEQGLLGMAFHPNYQANGFFYVFYTDVQGGVAYDNVARYTRTTADIANPASFQRVIRVQDPFSNHNGGNIAFGPDGYLYVGIGDGGSANDPGNRAQTITNMLLGKFLRLDVNGDDFPADPERNYAIPMTNPFVGVTGDDEIWSYGWRNPWRWCFDRLTGDLYVGDVGQNLIEEIDFEPANTPGRNYGWRCMEGLNCTGLTGCTCNAPTLTNPIHTYSHSGGGCSVTGGCVYRGTCLPSSINGTYFFAEYCTNQIWSLKYTGGMVTQFMERTAELAPGGGFSINSVTSFGEDSWGEIFIVDQGGEIWKIVPRGPLQAIAASPRIGTNCPINLTSTQTPSQTYAYAFSFGTTPGIPLPDGRVIPLNPDPLFTFSLTPGNGVFLNTTGTLSAGGTATVNIQIPNAAPLIDVTIMGAYVTLSPTAPSGISAISCPIPITFEP
jgi:glucose/arabinose dehydrogenase